MFDYDDGLGDSTVALPVDDVAALEHPTNDGAYASPMTAGLRPSRKGGQGVIKSINKETHSYEVMAIGSDAPLQGVARLMASPGDARMLPMGCRVALSYEYGQPLIVGCLPHTVGREDNRKDVNITGETITGGAADVGGGEAHGNYRTPHMPRDLGPGDEGIVSPEGNFVGALQGGVNLMKSGMAEVRTHMINDMLELLCRNYRLHTDMGISEIKNEAGRVSWSFRGGADQLTETGGDQENWSIRMDLGAEGDLFNFELTKPDGGSLFKLHVDSDGKLEIFAKDGLDEFSGADKVTKILANRECVIKGDDKQVLGGSQDKVINGNRATTLGGSDTTTVGNDHTQSIMRNQTINVGGQLKETAVGGDPTVATPLNVARATNIVNGSWEVNIGDPLDGGNPAALAGYLLETFLGDIKLKIKTAGDVHLNTLLGDATLDTLAGLATLKTALGVANVDGTTVNLGPVGASLANPLVKGTVHTTIFGAYAGTNIAALTPSIAATAAMLVILAPPIGPLIWNSPSAMIPAFMSWFASIMATLTTLLASNATLAGALASSLSTKSFTA